MNRNLSFVIAGVAITVIGGFVIFFTLNLMIPDQSELSKFQYYDEIKFDDCRSKYLVKEKGKGIKLSEKYPVVMKDTNSGFYECMNSLDFEPVQVSLGSVLKEPHRYYLKKILVETKFKNLPDFIDRPIVLGWTVCEPPKFFDGYMFDQWTLWALSDDGIQLAVKLGKSPYESTLSFRHWSLPEGFADKQVLVEGILIPQVFEEHGCMRQSAYILLNDISKITLIE